MNQAKWYKIRPEERETIKILYESGVNTVKLGERYKVSKSQISRLLKQMGVKVGIYKPNITEPLLTYSEQIIEKYQIGKTIEQLSKEYNVGKHIIRKILLSNNLILRSHVEESKIYKPRKDYFTIIDDEYKAYFFGLLLADGCNNGKNISISLIEEDSYLLEKLSEQIFINFRPLIDRKLKHVKDSYHNQKILFICDEKIKHDLEKHGMVRHKTSLLKNILIDDSLFRHFLRGFFDGDGSIFFTKSHNKFKKDLIQFKISFVGTFDFLSYLKNQIEKFLNCKIDSKIYDCKGTEIVKQLRISKRENIIKLYNFMYDDSKIFMKRKYEKFLIFMEKINENRIN